MTYWLVDGTDGWTGSTAGKSSGSMAGSLLGSMASRLLVYIYIYASFSLGGLWSCALGLYSGTASSVANQSNAGMTIPVAEDTDEV